MKKLIVSIIFILLGVIIFFQYKSYTRINAHQEYDYSISNNIDVNYFDPTILKDYYKQSYEIGTFAREQWRNYRIDVRYPKKSSEQSLRATVVYNKMLSSVKDIEGKLEQSKKLKDIGFSNFDIQQIFEQGLSVEDYQLHQLFSQINLKFGDEGQDVYLIQKKLNELGYTLRKDGIFNKETKAIVMEFQESKGLFPSGIANESTLQYLFEETHSKSVSYGKVSK